MVLALGGAVCMVGGRGYKKPPTVEVMIDVERAKTWKLQMAARPNIIYNNI